jgi:signal peptidase II
VSVLYISLGILLADQAAKLAVKGFSIPALGIFVPGVTYGSTRPILGDFLRLTYIENPGMAFGIDIGGKLFFSLFTVAASVGILYYLYRMREEPLLFRFSLALILGGAVGNLIDRVFYGVIFGEAPLFYGRVVDFIDVDFIDISIFGFSLDRWPVFNFADAAVTTGVALLLFARRSVPGPAGDPEPVGESASGSVPGRGAEPPRHPGHPGPH